MSITIEPTVRVETRRQPLPPRERLERIFGIESLDALYGGKPAIKDVSLDVYKNLVTAIIGPSGCGKSTFIRCLNRMNDLIPGFTQTGTIRYHGQDITATDVDPVAVRRHIGMVFQRPNPFPKSIYDNVAWGLKVLGMKDGLDDRVERALTQAALWDEVKDRLKASALSLSGGQQQRLCIARAIAVEPDVVLDGRARVGARPDRDGGDRAADERSEERVHVRDRHAQHAAGRARRRHDGVLLDLARRRRRALRRARRVRRDREDLHRAVRQAHGGLRHRTVRLTTAAVRRTVRRSRSTPAAQGRAATRVATTTAATAATTTPARTSPG